MLAAFVTPNHPAIPAVLQRAATILERWTGDPSFDDYQSRSPDRVKKQMAAVYEAVSALDILYCTVPASFEERGQQIRLADSVLAGGGMANCLDLSLLYAACLEAAGLHPLVVIIAGHAFTGAWLVDESFADSVSDDPSLLTKRIAEGINEIAVVEATCMNRGKSMPFDDATRAAAAHLAATNEFILFIDVKRARAGRIRPLPLRIPTPTSYRIEEDTPPATTARTAPEALRPTTAVVEGPAPLPSKRSGNASSST